MFLDISNVGSIIFLFGTDDPLDMPAESSCALDLVEEYGRMTLSQIGDMWGITRERIRQIEFAALRKLGRKAAILQMWNERKD